MIIVKDSVLTVDQLLKNSFRNYQNQRALHFENDQMTYSELFSSANQIAHALHHEGVCKNTRVAILMSNCLEYIIAEVGIYFSGGTVVGLNDMLGKDDIYYILKDSDAKVVFVDEPFIDLVKSIKERLPNLTTVVGIKVERETNEGYVTWNDFIVNQPSSELVVKVQPSDQSRIMYSGGTTGFPKGAVHCHKTTYIAILSTLQETKIQSNDRILLATPLAHMAYLDYMNGLITGAEIYIEKKFRAETYLTCIETNRITHLCAVPTMIYRILDALRERKFNVSSVRTIKYGGASINAERLKEGLQVFGYVFLQMYGLSETQNCPTWLRKEDHVTEGEKLKLLNSCGQTTFFSEVKIVNDDHHVLPPGEVGEIIINSASNLVKYNKLPEKTSEVLKENWLCTGDMGYMDENGYLYIMDRKKDMIISGGMNIYSAEVENVLQRHPDVSQVAVIGLPDDDWGEIVTAIIIPVSNNVTTKEIDEFCRKELAKYKKPKLIKFVETFPLTRYGKINKKVLRNSFLPV